MKILFRDSSQLERFMQLMREAQVQRHHGHTGFEQQTQMGMEVWFFYGMHKPSERPSWILSCAKWQNTRGHTVLSDWRASVPLKWKGHSTSEVIQAHELAQAFLNNLCMLAVGTCEGQMTPDFESYFEVNESEAAESTWKVSKPLPVGKRSDRELLEEVATGVRNTPKKPDGCGILFLTLMACLLLLSLQKSIVNGVKEACFQTTQAGNEAAEMVETDQMDGE